MRYVSLFSGVEAASLAWLPLGFEPMAFSEIDPFPCAVLAHGFPDVPNLGDVSKIDWGDFIAGFGRPNVVVGGSPCQSFSVAGTRTGLKGASGLMWEYVRAVRELVPRCFVWENVPGALSSLHGEDFGCLLRSMDELGYGLAWRVLDAQFFGVAQRRRRVFLVGVLGDAECACQILFERARVPWDTRPSREKRQELASRAGRCAVCSGFKFHQGSGAGSIGYEREQSPTLTADWHNPAVLCLAGDSDRAACDEDMCGTLTAHDAKGGPMVAMAGNGRGDCLNPDDPQSKRVFDPDGCAPTLSSGTREGMNIQPSVLLGSHVRRLTPRECERLQGMPDDWTRIPYRGRPADECPDGPRYKAIGNSMAVPVMRWIGERIAAALLLAGEEGE